MKLSIKILLLCFIVATTGSQCFGQKDSMMDPPYLRFPTVPPFKLMRTDSVSFYTKADLPKKKAVLLILFNPACDHCQREAEELVAHINDFKDVQIVMSTNMFFEDMKDFEKKYNLADHNIWVGRDVEYILPAFYRIHNIPYLAMYNKNGDLITTFEGSMKIEDILKTLHKK
jgi:thioredoxin-related protein